MINVLHLGIVFTILVLEDVIINLVQVGNSKLRDFGEADRIGPAGIPHWNAATHSTHKSAAKSQWHQSRNPGPKYQGQHP